MATDELTAEQVEDMRLTALLRVDPMAGRVMALSGSHEALRQQVATLTEECERWREKAARDVKRIGDQSCKLAEVRAENTEYKISVAKQIAVMREVSDPWRAGAWQDHLGAISFVCGWCLASVDGDFSRCEPEHPKNGCLYLLLTPPRDPAGKE